MATAMRSPAASSSGGPPPPKSGFSSDEEEEGEIDETVVQMSRRQPPSHRQQQQHQQQRDRHFQRGHHQHHHHKQHQQRHNRGGPPPGRHGPTGGNQHKQQQQQQQHRRVGGGGGDGKNAAAAGPSGHYGPPGGHPHPRHPPLHGSGSGTRQHKKAINFTPPPASATGASTSASVSASASAGSDANRTAAGSDSGSGTAGSAKTSGSASKASSSSSSPAVVSGTSTPKGSGPGPSNQKSASAASKKADSPSKAPSSSSFSYSSLIGAEAEKKQVVPPPPSSSSAIGTNVGNGGHGSGGHRGPGANQRGGGTGSGGSDGNGVQPRQQQYYHQHHPKSKPNASNWNANGRAHGGIGPPSKFDHSNGGAMARGQQRSQQHQQHQHQKQQPHHRNNGLNGRDRCQNPNPNPNPNQNHQQPWNGRREANGGWQHMSKNNGGNGGGGGGGGIRGHFGGRDEGWGQMPPPPPPPPPPSRPTNQRQQHHYRQQQQHPRSSYDGQHGQSQRQQQQQQQQQQSYNGGQYGQNAAMGGQFDGTFDGPDAAFFSNEQQSQAQKRMRYNDEGFAARGQGWYEERNHSHQGSGPPKELQWSQEQSSYQQQRGQGWQQKQHQWGEEECGYDRRAPQQHRHDQFESKPPSHHDSSGWRQQGRYPSAEGPRHQANRLNGGDWGRSNNSNPGNGQEQQYQARQLHGDSRTLPTEPYAPRYQESSQRQDRPQQQKSTMAPQKAVPVPPASFSQEGTKSNSTPVASEESAPTPAAPTSSSSIASGPSSIQKMARELIAKKAREREQRAKEEARRKAQERELAEAAAAAAAADAASSGRVSLAQRLHSKLPSSTQKLADAGVSLTGESERFATKKRKFSDAEDTSDADANQLRVAESTDTPNLTENAHTAGEYDAEESAKAEVAADSGVGTEIPAVSESPHSVHSKDVPEPMDVEPNHIDSAKSKLTSPADVKEPLSVDEKGSTGASEDDRKARVLVFSSDDKSSDSDTSSSESDSNDEDMMAWAAKMLQAKQKNVQKDEQGLSTPSAANPMDPDTDVPSPAVGSKSLSQMMKKKQKKKRRKETKEKSSSNPAEKKRRSPKPKKPKKTKDQKKLEMLEHMYASSDDEAGGLNADGTPGGPPTAERALTDAEVRAILGDDFNSGGGGNYVRRSTRQPSRSVLDQKGVRALISKLENNDRDMAVLKMKKYLPDPDTKPIAIDAILNALEKNTNCQALYIQNFNEGMRDDQVLHLIRVLQNPSCNIWCINIGETYNVQDRTWEKFAKGLKKTKVTHMYASEHTITNNLKDYIRLTIRNNRSKHQMHIDPDNLDVIIQCTHCWWNPINAKILRPYLRKKGYEHLLFDKELQGTKDASATAVVNGGETGATGTGAENVGASN